MLREKRPIATVGEAVGTTSPSAEDTRSLLRAPPARPSLLDAGDPHELLPGTWVRITSGCHVGRKARVEAVSGDRATITINWDVPISLLRQISIGTDRLTPLVVSGRRDAPGHPGEPSASEEPPSHRP
jgi:hypothetical protein